MRNLRIKIKSFSPAIIYGILVVVAGLVLPIILIPLVSLLGYSEIVEEIAKTAIVLFLIFKLPTRKMRILAGIGFGFLFGLSEILLYLNQIFQFGDISVFWERLLWTVPMHIFTVLVIIFFGSIRKDFLIFGLTAAIILHLVFNCISARFV